MCMAICSSQEEGPHMAAHRVLRLCRIVNGKWYKPLTAGLTQGVLGDGPAGETPQARARAAHKAS
jgi:hypothetical protein